jgi:hypothetical protein
MRNYHHNAYGAETDKLPVARSLTSSTGCRTISKYRLARSQPTVTSPGNPFR